MEVWDADGHAIPVNKVGNDIEWHIPQGRANITLPWDENPWKRWMTGVEPGPYRITTTINTRDGETLTGEMVGQIVP